MKNKCFKTLLFNKIILLSCCLLSFSQIMLAQTDYSTTITANGIVVSRMTTTERMNIANPEMSLLVYDTTAGGYWYFDGTEWKGAFGPAGVQGAAGDSFWTQNGTAISYAPDSDDGKVIIGTVTDTPGTYSLYVDNGILAERVRVALQSTDLWSDDAFGKKPSLAKMKKFIQKNSHLIGMPSADELVKTGIDMAEMDASLLAQIEWLWETLIEENKQKELLEAKNKAQDREIQLLNKRLDRLEKILERGKN